MKLKYKQHPLVSVASFLSLVMADRGVKASLMGMCSIMCGSFLDNLLLI